MRTYDFGGTDYLNTLTLGAGNSIYAAGSRQIAGHTVFAMLQLPQHGGPPTCFPNPCHWPSGETTVRSSQRAMTAGTGSRPGRWHASTRQAGKSESRTAAWH